MAGGMGEKMHRPVAASLLGGSVIVMLDRNRMGLVVIDCGDLHRHMIVDHHTVPTRRRDEAEHGDKRQHGSEERRRVTTHRHPAQLRRRLRAGQEDHGSAISDGGGSITSRCSPWLRIARCVLSAAEVPIAGGARPPWRAVKEPAAELLQ